MDEKIKKLERDLAEWKARAEKAEKEAADLRKEIEELKKQLKDKNVRITELETENLTLKEKVKNLEKKVRTTWTHAHTSQFHTSRNRSLTMTPSMTTSARSCRS